MQAVVTYCKNRFRITSNQDFTFIHGIELYVPDKAEALKYLDNGGEKPKREALVTLVRPELFPPRVEILVVGPLPQPNAHRLSPRLNGTVPYRFVLCY